LGQSRALFNARKYDYRARQQFFSLVQASCLHRSAISYMTIFRPQFDRFMAAIAAVQGALEIL
jgi:hypothetical protein